jgi:hypothetical protein
MEVMVCRISKEHVSMTAETPSFSSERDSNNLRPKIKTLKTEYFKNQCLIFFQDFFVFLFLVIGDSVCSCILHYHFHHCLESCHCYWYSYYCREAGLKLSLSCNFSIGINKFTSVSRKKTKAQKYSIAQALQIPLLMVLLFASHLAVTCPV